MKKLTILLSFLASTLLTFGQNGGKNFIDQNYIEVTGFAETLIVPDRIYLNIIINEKDLKGKSLAQTEQYMFRKLEALKIDVNKDLAINDLISNYKYSKILRTDIHLIKQYQLLTYDASTAVAVIYELEKLGISNVSIEKLDHSKMDQFRKSLKIEAIQLAKHEATSLTTAIGQSIGKALYINENRNRSLNMIGEIQNKPESVMLRREMSSYGSALKMKGADIEFEKIKLHCYIDVRFELK